MAAFDILDDANTVTSLAQAGFNYPLDSPGLSYKSTLLGNSDLSIIAVHIGFSPSACAAVGLDSEGQIHLRIMEHSYGAENGHYDEST